MDIPQLGLNAEDIAYPDLTGITIGDGSGIAVAIAGLAAHWGSLRAHEDYLAHAHAVGSDQDHAEAVLRNVQLSTAGSTPTPEEYAAARRALTA